MSSPQIGDTVRTNKILEHMPFLPVGTEGVITKLYPSMYTDPYVFVDFHNPCAPIPRSVWVTDLQIKRGS